jgi:hypothetical protein
VWGISARNPAIQRLRAAALKVCQQVSSRYEGHSPRLARAISGSTSRGAKLQTRKLDLKAENLVTALALPSEKLLSKLDNSGLRRISVRSTLGSELLCEVRGQPE